jgi:hypothetical protein
MTAMKRRGARNTREKREAARSTRGVSSAVQQDLAESQRRAKAAKTPIAKAVTRQVLERKRRAYSGQAAREAGAQTRRGVNPADVGTTARRSAPRGKRSSSRKT